MGKIARFGAPKFTPLFDLFHPGASPFKIQNLIDLSSKTWGTGKSTESPSRLWISSVNMPRLAFAKVY